MGIWWTIGLASPLATEVLIRVFVFAWAIEWIFFLIEIVAGFLFYYLWERLTPRTHALLGWTYAISAFLSQSTLPIAISTAPTSAGREERFAIRIFSSGVFAQIDAWK